MTVPPPENVAAAFNTAPPAVNTRLMQIRDLIYEAAYSTGTGPLIETLKWGQPAYLPAKRAGTTLRLGWNDANCILYVHCQTDLVARWRALYAEHFQFEGTRAAHIPAATPLPTNALQHMAEMALTYHHQKSRSAAL
ncbi:DUF1801 domain-containing protein [Roseovarius sp. EL26]|uniref:DUF1801 domain-containing protein n=1 Tax=Roseovarius sp. EL26 TaxID=2126672 RepID=UPI000EA406C4|nr:DUF1801 domain-containing protein [Roseovarius sp. EL26]